MWVHSTNADDSMFPSKKVMAPVYAIVVHNTNNDSGPTLNPVACWPLGFVGAPTSSQAYEIILAVLSIDRCGVRMISPGTILGFIKEKLQECDE